MPEDDAPKKKRGNPDYVREPRVKWVAVLTPEKNDLFERVHREWVRRSPRKGPVICSKNRLFIALLERQAREWGVSTK
jgi:hypothetical protein